MRRKFDSKCLTCGRVEEENGKPVNGNICNSCIRGEHPIPRHNLSPEVGAGSPLPVVSTRGSVKGKVHQVGKGGQSQTLSQSLDRSGLELLADSVVEKGHLYRPAPRDGQLPQLTLTALGGSPGQKSLLSSKVIVNDQETSVIVARNCNWSAMIVPADRIEMQTGASGNRILEELRMLLSGRVRTKEARAVSAKGFRAPVIEVGGKPVCLTLKRGYHPALVTGDQVVVIVEMPRGRTLDQIHQAAIDKSFQTSAED